MSSGGYNPALDDALPPLCPPDHIFGCPGPVGGEHQLIRDHRHAWHGPGSHGYRWCLCGAERYPDDELVPEEDEPEFLREGLPEFNGAFG